MRGYFSIINLRLSIFLRGALVNVFVTVNSKPFTKFIVKITAL